MAVKSTEQMSAGVKWNGRDVVTEVLEGARKTIEEGFIQASELPAGGEAGEADGGPGLLNLQEALKASCGTEHALPAGVSSLCRLTEWSMAI